jgi:hypothetical protein
MKSKLKNFNLENPLEYSKEKYQYSEIKEFLESELGIDFDDISVYLRTSEGHFKPIQKRNDEVMIIIHPDGECEIIYPL